MVTIGRFELALLLGPISNVVFESYVVVSGQTDRNLFVGIRCD